MSREGKNELSREIQYVKKIRDVRDGIRPLMGNEN